MKLSGLFKTKDPITGQTSDIFDLGDILARVLGVVMFFIIFAAGQNAAGFIGKKIPVDTTIEPVVNRPIMSNDKVLV